jgi:hypothetical protein
MTHALCPGLSRADTLFITAKGVGLIDNDTVGYGWSSLRITFAPSFSILCAFYIAPELLSPRLRFVGSVERFAVQRSGRRQAGAAILRRCVCGDQIRCNGLFDSGFAGQTKKDRLAAGSKRY